MSLLFPAPPEVTTEVRLVIPPNKTDEPTPVEAHFSLNRTKKKKRNPKRVRFSEQKIIIWREHDDDIWACWFHPKEYRTFLAGARQTVLAFRNEGARAQLQLDPSEHCLLGLERHQLSAEARAIYRHQNKEFKRFLISQHTRLRLERYH